MMFSARRGQCGRRQIELPPAKTIGGNPFAMINYEYSIERIQCDGYVLIRKRWIECPASPAKRPYCKACGAGPREASECEWPDCELET